MSLMDLINKYTGAIENQVKAEIDASCCQTRRDWDNAHKAQEERYELQEQLEQSVAILESAQTENNKLRIKNRALQEKLESIKTMC